MIFEKHSNLKGKHAFFSASSNSWLNYDADHLIDRWEKSKAVSNGTKIHSIAEKLILEEKKVPRAMSSIRFLFDYELGKDSVFVSEEVMRTFREYVNDAISFGMIPEQVLFYSDNFFGTADTISYNEKKQILRIHDLKTGVVPAKMEQLEVYAALFYLEYELYLPPLSDIEMELRIYQNDELKTFNPDMGDIFPIVDKIVEFDRILNERRAQL